MTNETPEKVGTVDSEPKKFLNLEETLGKLRNSEVRASLETYIPAIHDAFHGGVLNDSEGYRQGALDIARFLLEDLQKEVGYSPRKINFFKELLDLRSRNLKSDQKELDVKEYQLMKDFVNKNFNVPNAVVAQVESVLDFLKSPECPERYRKDFPYANLDSYLNIEMDDDLYDRMKAKIGDVPFIPKTQLATGKFFSELTKYIEAKGVSRKDMEHYSPRVDVLSNLMLPYRLLEVTGSFFPHELLSKIYTETVEEIPGLKEKVVEIAKKYGVDMKIE